jgi:hypothetical protein
VSVAPIAATEKSASAWSNAVARLGRLGPELRRWLEELEVAGEQEGLLLLIDRRHPSPCSRCEALLAQALAPLGYAGAKILTAPRAEDGSRR